MREKLGYVTEADLDLILVLDAWTGGPLIPFLASRAGVELGYPVRAARSTLRCDGQRETDVEVSWAGGALLIEDKIDAPFTPGQPESYRTEVDARCKDGSEVVRSILVCPKRRLPTLEPEAGRAFDVIVTCEDLAEVARTAGAAGAAAVVVLDAASEAKPTRPVTSVDFARSEWGDGYRRAFAALVAPDAGVHPGEGSLRTAGAEWMYFRRDGVDTAAVWSLAHWIPSGLVRMELMVLDPPRDLPAGADLVPKRVQHWVEVQVPPMTFDRPATEQAEQLREVVDAVTTLRRWAAGADLRPRPPKAKGAAP